VLIAGVCLLTVLPAQIALAAFAGANGKILFITIRGIETVHPDGTGRTVLTQVDRSEPVQAAWSPDGQRIVFNDERAGNRDIYVMNADGSDQTRITSDPASDFYPAWSPDGTKIVFERYTGNSLDIYTMNSDGSGETNITNSSQWEYEPAWSPDGSNIAYSGIATINPDGTGFTHLPTGYVWVYPEFGCFAHYWDDSPNWSPDGGKLVFTHYEEESCFGDSYEAIFVMNRNGSNWGVLHEPVQGNLVHKPVWSPDGSTIVVGDASGELYFVDASTGNRIRTLLGNANDYACCVDWQPLKPLGYARPRGATPSNVMLAPAFEPCSSANASHAAPLDVGSCSPAVPASAHLTVGTPEANGVGAKSTGKVKFETFCNPPAPNPRPPCTETGDQIDAALTASLTDVRNRIGLSDYTGELRVTVPARITDRFNGAGSVHPGTALDAPIAFNVTCLATADETIGSTCSASTSLDALMPGIALEGKRAVWTLGEVAVYDGGADGDADTAGDNTLFMEQGLFVP
jgi:hypothetical protein